MPPLPPVEIGLTNLSKSVPAPTPSVIHVSYKTGMQIEIFIEINHLGRQSLTEHSKIVFTKPLNKRIGQDVSWKKINAQCVIIRYSIVTGKW